MSYRSDYLERVKIEIFVRDGEVQKVVESIISNATTESVGDGKVLILPVESIIDIGSNETGENAI